MKADVHEYVQSDVASARLMDAAKALHASPCDIADVFGASPERIERLLLRRGQRCGEGESLRECVARHYGERVADEIDALFSEDGEDSEDIGGSKWFTRT